jgi:ketosteroid isomerase-like protein
LKFNRKPPGDGWFFLFWCMKNILTFLVFLFPLFVFGQISQDQKQDAIKIHQLIGEYSKARETMDTTLLKNILMDDIDQLVSSGEWRIGIREAIKGMQESSQSNPGSRTLKVERIKYLNNEFALVDCRYIIKSPDGTERKLWSSFTVVFHKNRWKISAIRNMSPTVAM